MCVCVCVCVGLDLRARSQAARLEQSVGQQQTLCMPEARPQGKRSACTLGQPEVPLARSALPRWPPPHLQSAGPIFMATFLSMTAAYSSPYALRMDTCGRGG